MCRPSRFNTVSASCGNLKIIRIFVIVITRIKYPNYEASNGAISSNLFNPRTVPNYEASNGAISSNSFNPHIGPKYEASNGAISSNSFNPHIGPRTLASMKRRGCCVAWSEP